MHTHTMGIRTSARCDFDHSIGALSRSSSCGGPPRTGTGPTHEDDLIYACGTTTTSPENRTTRRNVATTSADDRTDTTNPPRTGTGPTNEDDLHTCQSREKFWRDKRGATERSERTSEGGSPRKISKTYIANDAIFVIPELYL